MPNFTYISLFIVIAMTFSRGVAFGEDNTRADEAYRIALGRRNNGLHEEAVEKFKAFLKSYPGDAKNHVALYFLSESLVALKKYDEAIISFEIIRKKHSKSDYHAEALFRIGELNQLRGKNDKAISAFKDFTRLYPANKLASRVNEKLGRVFASTGKHKEAADSFNKFLEKDGTSEKAAGIRLRLARSLTALKKNDEAVKQYLEIKKKFRSKQVAKEATLDLAYLYLDMGKNKEAVSEAKQVSGATDDISQDASYLIGSILFNQGKHKDAANAYKSFLSRFPKSDKAESARLNIANSLIVTGDDKQALEYLKQVRNIKKDEACYLTASAYKRLKNNTKATEYFLKIANNFPKSIYRQYSLFELGMIGGLDKKNVYWKKLVDDYPGGDLSSEALYFWGAALAEKGDDKKAVGLLGKIPSKSKRYSDAEVLKVQLQAKSDTTAALKSLDKIKTGSINPEILAQLRYALALSLLEKGKSGDAIKLFDQVLAEKKAEKFHSDSLYRKGLANEKLKKNKEAIKAFDEQVKRFPKSNLAPYSLLRKGAVLKQTDQAGALKVFREILKKYPGFAHKKQVETLILDARYREGWALYKAKKYAEAVVLFDQIKDDKTYGAEVSYLAGLCSRELKKTKDVEKYMKYLLSKYPGYKYSAEAQGLLGETLTEQSKWQEAIKHYTKYNKNLKDGEKKAAEELKLGISLYNANLLSRAKEALKYGSEKGDAFVKAKSKFFLGEILLNQKKYNEAKDLFLDVSILYKHDDLTPASLLEAGKCYLELGKKDKCEKMLNKLIKDYPKSPYAVSAKKMLK